MITSIIPKLPFIDKDDTIRFYTNLGFRFSADYGDYLIASQDEQEIHFFSFPSLIPKKSDFMIYVRVEEEIDALYHKCIELSIPVANRGSLEIKPWRQKEFSISDPNGTCLTFGQAV